MPKMLIIDDDPAHAEATAGFIREKGHAVTVAKNSVDGIDILRDSFFDIVLTDAFLPSGAGIVLVKRVKKISPSTLILVMADNADIGDVVKFVKRGAYDFVQKAWTPEKIWHRVAHAMQTAMLYEGMDEFSVESMQMRYGALIGSSDVMREIYHMIDKVAQSDAPVLIDGASGTGKEPVAKEVHFRGRRREKPFITVNCGSMAGGTVESELFGHEKGAFTGAIEQKKGKLEMADGGTLFLDEVCELTKEIQVKLLRFLQEGELHRLGSHELLHVDARIIASTNKNIVDEIESGRFREDLYYRIHVFSMTIPKLKDRENDCIELAQHFIDKYNHKYNKRTRLTGSVIDLLRAYNWPGNVRELENVVSKAVIMSDYDELAPEHFPDQMRMPIRKHVETPEDEIGADLNTRVKNLEQRMIHNALNESGWNQIEAAKMLGIKRTTLQYKMKILKIKKRQVVR